jgi:Domain of unknown function (DUF4440)
MNYKFLIISLFIVVNIGWKSNRESEVQKIEAAIELFRNTMIKPDFSVFDRLTSESLSYGHSNGLVEDKPTCIHSLVSIKSRYKRLNFSDQTVKIIGDIALVRNTFFAETNDQGKDPVTAHIKVLMVWHKENGQWRLLARQATKIPPK